MPNIKIYLYFFFSLVSYQSIFAFQYEAYKSLDSCQLCTGTYYQFKVKEEGVYRIDYETMSKIVDAQTLNNLDVLKMSIFTMIGGDLPELFDQKIDRLQSIPFQKRGLEDGRWDKGDYVLVYLQGEKSTVVNQNGFKRLKSDYDNFHYCFVNFGSKDGVAINTQSAIPLSSSIVDRSKNIIWHENDVVNLLDIQSITPGSGRRWFGESFRNNNIQSFDFELENVIEEYPATLQYGIVGQGENSSSVNVSLENQSKNISFGPLLMGLVDQKVGSLVEDSFSTFMHGNAPVVIDFKGGGNSSNAYLDYLILTYQRINEFVGNPLIMYYDTSILDKNSSVVRFYYSGNSPTEIWDITEPLAAYRLEDFVISQTNVSFEVRGNFKKFIVFNTSNLPALQFEKIITNVQLLPNRVEALNKNLIIIYAQDFKSTVEQYIEMRKDQFPNYNFIPIEVNDIFMEYGAGKSDPSAIRNYLYDFHSEYGVDQLLLWGSASFDIKGNKYDTKKSSYVPTFITSESLDPILAFPTDDYYAIFKHDIGNSLLGKLEFPISRLAFEDVQQAINYIQKLKRHINNQVHGELSVAMIADDEDYNLHLFDAERISNYLTTNFGVAKLKKIYLDAYHQQNNSGGQRYPEVNLVLQNLLNNDAILVNYFGHGGPSGWSQERVLTLGEVQGLKNEYYPTIFTATCTFAPFDDPSIVSAGEALISQANGGSIALLTTVRPVYASRNYNLVQEFYAHLTDTKKGEYISYPQIIQRAKNEPINNNTNTRKFFYFGDPFLKLPLPNHQVIIDSIDGKSLVAGEIIPLNKLTKHKISGKIVKIDSKTPIQNTGMVNVSVYDKAYKYYTRANDKESQISEFTEQNSLLFKKNFELKDGLFSGDIIIPKDVQTSNLSQNDINNFGKLNFNFIDNQVSGIGSYPKIAFVEDMQSQTLDKEPPKIYALADESTLTNGSITSTQFVLTIILTDNLAVNTSGLGIGHNTTLRINDGEAIDLQDNIDQNISTTDSVKYLIKLSNLPTNTNYIIISGYDIANNYNIDTIYFTVIEQTKNNKIPTKVAPNPTNGTFSVFFNIFAQKTVAKAKINICNILGQNIYSKTIDTKAGNTALKFDIDSLSHNIQNGIYLYHINLYDKDNKLVAKSDLSKIQILK